MSQKTVTTSVDMTEVLALKNELGSLDRVQKALKAIQSTKCRLKKRKSDPDYQTKMTETVQREQLLKEVRQLFTNKPKSVPEYDETDIAALDYDETLKAIKSIQSKKCLSKYEPDELEKAIRVEEMLLEHKKLVKPVDDTAIKKSELKTMLDEAISLKQREGYKYLIARLTELTQ
jgi:hypothetical protein